MDVYISDVKLDAAHPQSIGDAVEDRLAEVFPEGSWCYGVTLREVLLALLDEIVRLRNQKESK